MRLVILFEADMSRRQFLSKIGKGAVAATTASSAPLGLISSILPDTDKSAHAFYKKLDLSDETWISVHRGLFDFPIQHSRMLEWFKDKQVTSMQQVLHGLRGWMLDLAPRKPEWFIACLPGAEKFIKSINSHQDLIKVAISKMGGLKKTIGQMWNSDGDYALYNLTGLTNLSPEVAKVISPETAYSLAANGPHKAAQFLHTNGLLDQRFLNKEGDYIRHQETGAKAREHEKTFKYSDYGDASVGGHSTDTVEFEERLNTKLRLEGVHKSHDWEMVKDLFGKVPDREIAKHLGVSGAAVNYQRNKLGVAPSRPYTTDTDWDNVGLGKVPDLQLAKQLGVGTETVRYHRLKRGLPSARSFTSALSGGPKGLANKLDDALKQDIHEPINYTLLAQNLRFTKTFGELLDNGMTFGQIFKRIRSKGLGWVELKKQFAVTARGTLGPDLANRLKLELDITPQYVSQGDEMRSPAGSGIKSVHGEPTARIINPWKAATGFEANKARFGLDEP